MSSEGFQDVLLGGEDPIPVLDGEQSGFHVEWVLGDPDHVPRVPLSVLLKELRPAFSLFAFDELRESLLLGFPVLMGRRLAAALELDVDFLIPPFLAPGRGALRQAVLVEEVLEVLVSLAEREAVVCGRVFCVFGEEVPVCGCVEVCVGSSA